MQYLMKDTKTKPVVITPHHCPISARLYLKTRNGEKGENVTDRKEDKGVEVQKGRREYRPSGVKLDWAI